MSPVSTIDIERHPLQPFLPANGKVLFLGSFPPPRQRWCMDFFYPNFINDHWRIEGEIFFGNRNHFIQPGAKKFDKEKIVAFLNEKGIGFYDTACAVRRLKENASDLYLEVVESTDITALLRQMPMCEAIATTGEKASATICQYFGVSKIPAIGSSVPLLWGNSLQLYRLPSSSRAYPLSFDKKVEAYRTFFQCVGLL